MQSFRPPKYQDIGVYDTLRSQDHIRNNSRFQMEFREVKQNATWFWGGEDPITFFKDQTLLSLQTVSTKKRH